MVTRRQFVGGMAVTGMVAATSTKGGLLQGVASAAAPGWVTERGTNNRVGRALGETAITTSTVTGLQRRWTKGGPTVPDTETLVQGTRAYSLTRPPDFTSPGVLTVRKTSDGSVVWSKTLPGIPSTPAIGSGRIVVYSQTDSPFVSAYNLSSGAPQWSVTPPFEAEAPLGGGLGLVGSKVVVGAGFILSVLRASDGGTVTKLDVAGGDFDSNGGASPMIDGNGTAWYGYKFLDTLAVPPSTVDPISGPKHVGNRASTPLLAGDRVFVASVTDLDVFVQATGAKTTLTSFDNADHHALAWDGTTLFASSESSGTNTLNAYDTTTGAVKWQKNGAVTAPFVVNGMVVVGEDTAGLAFYRATNGAELFRIPGTARGADPIVSNGQLFAGFDANAVPSGQPAGLSRFTL